MIVLFTLFWGTVVVLLALAPWGLAGRAAKRRAKATTAGWGAPSKSVEPGPGVWRGRLQCAVPCERFEGGDAAAATVSARREPDPVTVSGEGLVVEVDGAALMLAAPVEVLVGSREAALLDLGGAAQSEAAGRIERASGPWGSTVVDLRSLGAGDEIVLRGVASRVAGNSSPERYREGASERQVSWTPLPAMFFRLTNLVVHGPRFGADVTPYEEQLAALRSMVDGQPNPYLLQGRF